MKKNKLKKLFYFKISLLFLFSFAIVYGLYETNIDRQTATGTGSNSSKITVSYTGSITKYVNTGGNSSVIGNKFHGYYYDSVLGFFKLNWSPDKSQNVGIVSSTSKCSSGYGYKLGGFAQSEYYGFIDFDYSSDIFVYYCENDGKLHGEAYAKHTGFQSFEGIRLQLVLNVEEDLITEGTIEDPDTVKDATANSGAFVNEGGSQINTPGYDFINTLPDTDESIFYIIK